MRTGVQISRIHINAEVVGNVSSKEAKTQGVPGGSWLVRIARMESSGYKTFLPQYVRWEAIKKLNINFW